MGTVSAASRIAYNSIIVALRSRGYYVLGRKAVRVRDRTTGVWKQKVLAARPRLRSGLGGKPRPRVPVRGRPRAAFGAAVVGVVETIRTEFDAR